MCTNSKSYTMSRTLSLPPSSTQTTRSGPIKRKWSLSPISWYKPEPHHKSGSTSLGILKQPTTPLRITMAHHLHLLPAAYPGSLLAKDLVTGNLPLPQGSTTRPVDNGPTMFTASSATNSRTTPVHQQKSTFLIPSYSILLHLIPLILGVRRE